MPKYKIAKQTAVFQLSGSFVRIKCIFKGKAHDLHKISKLDKIGPRGPELIWQIHVNNLWITSNTNPGSYEARDLNLEITRGKLKNVYKFENLSHNDLAIFRHERQL